MQFKRSIPFFDIKDDIPESTNTNRPHKFHAEPFSSNKALLRKQSTIGITNTRGRFLNNTYYKFLIRTNFHVILIYTQWKSMEIEILNRVIQFFLFNRKYLLLRSKDSCGQSYYSRNGVYAQEMRDRIAFPHALFAIEYAEKRRERSKSNAEGRKREGEGCRARCT